MSGRDFAKLKRRAALARPSRDRHEEFRNLSVRGWRTSWPEEFPVTTTMREGRKEVAGASSGPGSNAEARAYARGGKSDDA